MSPILSRRKPGPKPRFKSRVDTNVRLEKRDYLQIKRAVEKLRRDSNPALSLNQFIVEAAASHARVVLSIAQA